MPYLGDHNKEEFKQFIKMVGSTIVKNRDKDLLFDLGHKITKLDPDQKIIKRIC